jgi:hypothetical protein
VLGLAPNRQVLKALFTLPSFIEVNASRQRKAYAKPASSQPVENNSLKNMENIPPSRTPRPAEPTLRGTPVADCNSQNAINGEIFRILQFSAPGFPARVAADAASRGKNHTENRRMLLIYNVFF